MGGPKLKHPINVICGGALLSLGLLGGSVTVHAQDTCASYVGTTIKPQTFDAAAAPFAKLTPKGEFETTAQYEARKAAATGGSAATVIVTEKSQQEFKYNADDQSIYVNAYAFHNIRFDTARAAMNAQPQFTGGGNIYAVVSQQEHITGSYVGQNGFGATTIVHKHIKHSNVIFERPAASSGPKGIEGESIFGGGGGAYLGKISMPPQQAKTALSALKLAIVLKPKDPYLANGSWRGDEPTFDSPDRYTYSFTILFADFQCGLVTDGANKVLAAYPMN